MLTHNSSPARVRDAWAAVLESGIVAQGRGQLAFTGVGPITGGPVRRFCCLGVLCELALEAGVIEYYDGNVGSPSDAVAEWAGLVHAAGTYEREVEYGDTESRSLAGDNDDGFTFEAIAEIIRGEPKGLLAEAPDSESDDSYYSL